MKSPWQKLDMTHFWVIWKINHCHIKPLLSGYPIPREERILTHCCPILPFLIFSTLRYKSLQWFLFFEPHFIKMLYSILPRPSQDKKRGQSESAPTTRQPQPRSQAQPRQGAEVGGNAQEFKRCLRKIFLVSSSVSKGTSVKDLILSISKEIHTPEKLSILISRLLNWIIKFRIFVIHILLSHLGSVWMELIWYLQEG